MTISVTSLACGNFIADDHYPNRWWHHEQHIAEAELRNVLSYPLFTKQQRTKWKAKEQNVKPGDVVMLACVLGFDSHYIFYDKRLLHSLIDT